MGDEENPPVPHAGSTIESSTVGLNDIDDRLDQRSRSEVLPRTRPLVRGALAQQVLVGVTLDVGSRATPVLLVDEVYDEALQLAGSWTLFCALRKIVPITPGCLPSPLSMRVYSNSSWSP